MGPIKLSFFAVFVVFSIVFFSNKNLFSQEQTQVIIKKAMKGELSRNMEKLTIENLKSPFFISYTVSDAKTLYISSTLGAIISSEQIPYRKQQVRVMVGDYKRNNENFVDMNSMWSYSFSESIPLDDEYYGIRRSFWKTTDSKYKSAAETYEGKISAINQQNLSEEDASLDDFNKAPEVKLNIPDVAFKFDKRKWENTAKELSGIFNDYSGIFSSNVSIFLYHADVYFLNSEETETKYPVTLSAIRVIGQTQAEDGEPLYDHLLYYGVTPEDLPSKEEMKIKVKAMADKLVEIRNAPVFDDSYSGPVLFEGQAVAEIFAQKFFSGNTGLIAKRKPILSQPQMASMMGATLENPIESRMNKKIISRDLTIKATPKLKKFEEKNLIGNFEVDAEGVIPEEELMLVEDGVLKNLLNGRTPTPKVKNSNGHKRIVLQSGGIASDIGPGVISVSTSNGISKNELKKKLIDAAKEEDLDYAFIIRKFECPNSGIEKKGEQSMFFSYGSGNEQKATISRPLYVYKVSIKNGNEELVRTVELESLSIKSLKRILAATGKQFAYNTVLNGDNTSGYSWYQSDRWSLNGIPASFIVPEAILFEELDIQTEKRAVTSKLPVLDNPVGK
ncbi:MAG: metallopeptidase TldD-related protein [Bacteroidota bacterium]